MNNQLLDKLFEVREYFLLMMPQEGERERTILDYIDEIIDGVEQ